MPRRLDAPRLRLLCFAHAGGGATVFHRWGEHLAPGVELRAAQLPGRGMRLREPPFRRLEALVAAITGEIVAADRPYALFGHSLGATVAFEVAREALRRGLPVPTRLFVACRPAPIVPRHLPPLHVLPDERFLAALQERYGEADAGLRHPELVQLMLPALKADIELLETWDFPGGAPLPVPITAFVARTDTSVAPEHIERWREHTAAAFELEWLDGGHFDHLQNPRPMVERVNARLAER